MTLMSEWGQRVFSDSSHGRIPGKFLRFKAQRKTMRAPHSAAPMELSFALKAFSVVLVLFCIALMPFFVRRDPAPVHSVVSIEALPRSQWPSLITRMGAVTLLASFVLLIGGCYLLLNG